MLRILVAGWSVALLCSCSTAAPAVRAEVLVVRPTNHRAVELTPEEFRDGMRVVMSNGRLPGASRAQLPRIVLVSTDPLQFQKAAGYLQFCERFGGPRDCWEVLTPAGGLDEGGSQEVALRIAFAEALREAAAAVGNITPDQVRAILSLTLAGTILAVLDPNPVTKALFVITSANLIAYLGVDLFNNVVKGYVAMAEELALAKDFAQVRSAGERYGQRLGPTLARVVLMVATYGLAKFAGLVTGGSTSLPGGPRAASLAETQGFRIPVAEGAKSIALAADGSVTIHLGAMTAAVVAGDVPASTPTGQKGSPLRVPDGTNAPQEIGGRLYSGHALDRMQQQGITPTVVESTIRNGKIVPGKIAGTSAHYDPANNLTVITNSRSGKVVTVDYGEIRQ